MALPPFADAPQEALANARGVIFDVDDTVTEDGRLQAEAFDAMWRARRAGLALVAVTGRPLGWSDVIARHWPVDLALGENGAGWAWVRDGRFFNGYYADEQTRLAYQAQLEGIRRAMSEAFPSIALAGDSIARRCDLAYDAFEEAQLDDATVQGAVSLIREHGAECFVSSVHIHAVPGDWNKARGCARALKAVLGEDVATHNARWWFVGDSGNDQAAFAFFENSVGVANISEHLERIDTPPRYVTNEARGRGYAEVVDALIQART